MPGNIFYRLAIFCRDIGDISEISRYFLGDISARRKYHDIFNYQRYLADIIITE